MSHVSERELQPGQVIADRYRLEAPIGRGAMGAVWRAVHVRLESPVAIKFLNAAIAGDPDMLERFMREARSAAAVRSSHVVQIFDYGVDGGAPYIAMELLVGEPLDERLEARGVLAPPELDKVFGEVARAVAVAHDLGVVHRDIKPANIFIAREGGHEVTKVLDFGIAKLIDRRLEAPVGSGTHTGIILGTPNYMSPEQARGHRHVDHRSDLWSLAVLAFECLTGRQPFESNALGDLVVKICTAEPLVPSQVSPVPAAFDAWFARGIDKDPEARFRSSTEMAEALHALLAAEGLAAESRPRSTPSRLEPVRIDIVPGRVTQRSSVPAPVQPAASETTQPSLTSKAVASEALAMSNAPARRRRFAFVAVPIAVLGVALAVSASRPSSEVSSAESRVARAAASAPGPALASSEAATSADTSVPAPLTAFATPAPVPAAPATPAAAATRVTGTLEAPATFSGATATHPPTDIVASPPTRGAARAPRAVPSSSHRPKKNATSASPTDPARPASAAPVTDPYADRL
ncbi:MAG TPA: protein kinase [Polyangiaceae bacterium]|nr:protein kinase [Polyangiaceae bacterium]